MEGNIGWAGTREPGRKPSLHFRRTVQTRASRPGPKRKKGVGAARDSGGYVRFTGGFRLLAVRKNKLASLCARGASTITSVLVNFVHDKNSSMKSRHFHDVTLFFAEIIINRRDVVQVWKL